MQQRAQCDKAKPKTITHNPLNQVRAGRRLDAAACPVRPKCNTRGGGYTWWGEACLMPSGGEGRGEGKGTYWMHFELGSRDYMKYMGRKHR